jgi:hypothetical protein
LASTCAASGVLRGWGLAGRDHMHRAIAHRRHGQFQITALDTANDRQGRTLGRQHCLDFRQQRSAALEPQGQHIGMRPQPRQLIERGHRLRHQASSSQLRLLGAAKGTKRIEPQQLLGNWRIAHCR